MDVLSPLFHLVFRALVVVIPMTVGLLSFRRVLLSQTSNAWIYATTCLFASITAIGLLPWALGLASPNSVFFLFAVISPIIWITVIMACDPNQTPSHYDGELDEASETAQSTTPETKIFSFRRRPLVLEQPEWPDAPVAIFRHSDLPVALRMRDGSSLEDHSEQRSIMTVARGMRGNANSDARRPKMLPAPKNADLRLPFLPPG